MEGFVKWFRDEDGIGFIEVEGQGDVFVHFTDILTDGYKTLDEGERVEFDLETHKRGRVARNVLRVDR